MLTRQGVALIVAVCGLFLPAAAAAARPPALVVTRLSALPASHLAGFPLVVHARVQNRGSRRVARPRVAFYVSHSGKRRLLTRVKLRPLAPRGSVALSARLRFAQHFAPGRYRLLACADSCVASKETLRVTAPMPIPPPSLPPVAPPADTTAPALSIAAPTAGSTTESQRPVISGPAGTEPGDAPAVHLDVYRGTDTAAAPVQALDATASEGAWSATASTLPAGRYTAVATQADAAGNTGRATATFDTPAVMLAAGDIAACGPDETGDSQTAAILAVTPADAIATLGDNVYGTTVAANYPEPATAQAFQDCFGPTWGPFKAKIHPSPGNHEYWDQANAAGYFGYFGAAAGDPSKGYYSYDVGSWHVIALNTSDRCLPEDGGPACDADSEQIRWLKADLAAHPQRCTMAYWHHPRFSSGSSSFSGEQPQAQPLLDALYAGGADVVLNGHSHIYERFAPQDPARQPRPDGIREFIVGTGGKDEHGLTSPRAPNSEVAYGDPDHPIPGVLQLTLRPDDYSWVFLPVAGKPTVDTGGTTACH